MFTQQKPFRTNMILVVFSCLFQLQLVYFFFDDVLAHKKKHQPQQTYDYLHFLSTHTVNELKVWFHAFIVSREKLHVL